MSSFDTKTIALGVIIGLILGGSIGFIYSNTKIAELNTGHLLLQNTISDLETTVSELTDTQSGYETQLSDYQGDIRDLESELSNTQDQVADLIEELQNINADKSTLESDFLALQKDYDDLLQQTDVNGNTSDTSDLEYDFQSISFSSFGESDPYDAITLTEDRLSWVELERGTTRSCSRILNLADPESFVFDFELTISELELFSGTLEMLKLFNLHSHEAELILYAESQSNPNIYNLVFHQRYGMNTFTWYSLHEGVPLLAGQTYYIRIFGKGNQYRVVAYSDQNMTNIVNDSGIRVGRTAQYNTLTMPEIGGYGHSPEPWTSGYIENLKYLSP
jgi:hypothetical protein